MSIVLVLEVDKSLADGVIESGEQPANEDRVQQVHTAPSAPDVLNDPGPLTLCGLDTSRMLAEPWAPDRPGSRWYPPRWAGRICPICDANARAS
ncbi:hypothetical protein EES39_09545 [Streptomyces sp. ADI92-24]|uniref:hypothetical protein n=1 Tax=Streptomyces sp. ADI92-24 TaxID=1522756 RepID=UPI000F55040A|nr:hypothetical protein [Streptomyces sp. ADI92-24]RPK48387.1 hypothetical protein EES39_09545 [Streptomyces sp. ADI92-24]